MIFHGEMLKKHGRREEEMETDKPYELVQAIATHRQGE